MSSPALKLSSRVAVLEPGMYIFRYTLPAGEQQRRSCISLHQSPMGKGSVDFFPGEGVSRSTLMAAGDCIVVRVKGATAGVLVTEFHPEAETNKVELRIDRISQNTSSVAPAEGTATPQPSASLALSLLGHIETRGDVTIDAGWLGNPDSALRIEGFSVRWANQPEGLDIAYMCRTGKGAEPQLSLSGQYIGTRRQAKPITSVAFALSGARAAEYELTGQVAFAGCPPLAISSDKELSGATGSEQLVAVRLEVKPRAAQASSPASPWSDTAAAKVFRSN